MGVGPLNVEPAILPWSLLMVKEPRDSSYWSNVLPLVPRWLAMEDFNLDMKDGHGGDPEL